MLLTTITTFLSQCSLYQWLCYDGKKKRITVTAKSINNYEPIQQLNKLLYRPSFRKILKQGRIRVLRELGGAKVTQKVLIMHGKDRVE